MGLLTGLNPEQVEVVMHDGGPLAVVARAGTGKTETAARRIARLVLDGADPAEILAVSFSRKAAAEIGRRCERWLGAGAVTVDTFHRFALRALKAEVPAYESWVLDDGPAYRGVLKTVTGWGEGCLNWREADPNYLEGLIAYAKTSLILPGSEEFTALAKQRAGVRATSRTDPERAAEAYYLAEKVRVDREILCLDDVVPELVRLFQRDPQVLASWASRFRHLMQDESQDAGLDQSTLADLLVQEHGNLTLIGDDAQSIYGFRGALPARFLAFAHRPGVRVLHLHRNYRSGSNILDVANAVLSKASEAHDAVAITAEREIAGAVSYSPCEDFDSEAQDTVRWAQELHADGVAWRDIACIFRVNAQSRALEEAMLASRLPYSIVGGVGFYERKEVLDVLAYLRVAAGMARWEDVERCINTPYRYIGRVTIQRLSQRAQLGGSLTEPRSWQQWAAVARDESLAGGLNKTQVASLQAWADIVQKLGERVDAREANPQSEQAAEGMPARLLSDLIVWTKFLAWLTSAEGVDNADNSRASNVRELTRVATRFAFAAELLAYCASIRKKAKESRALGDQIDAVVMLSGHRSKGLEWKHVAVLGVNEGILPHARGEVAEERRLFYVMVTRARDTLRVSSVRSAVIDGKPQLVRPSRFVAEGGLGALTPSAPLELLFAAADPADPDFSTLADEET